jgi:hypothetical protein
VRRVKHPRSSSRGGADAPGDAPSPAGTADDRSGAFTEFVLRERAFLAVLGVLFFITGAFYENAEVARWLGFLLAGYAAVANDSIQTIGTFIASNMKVPWWVLWMFIGGLFVVTVGYSWWSNEGDVSYGRLLSKGFAETPTEFTFLQVAAPIFLLILTRLRMPVSTTFLLLSSFAADADTIGGVLLKSVSGYGLAFVSSAVVWTVAAPWISRMMQGEAGPWWRPIQWVTSGFLWVVWLMQDAANIAVYLPRSLGPIEFTAFAGSIFCGLGLLFFMRGERVQEVVNEKSSVVDVRAATLIDLLYGAILYYFKVVSAVPMSTTWVFIGLLGGRELAMARNASGDRSVPGALRMLAKDLTLVGIGLLVSLALAIAVNPSLAPFGLFDGTVLP